MSKPAFNFKIARMTEADYLSEADLMNGICLVCHEITEGCEPDARNYRCEACKTPTVFGMEEALMMGMIEFKA